MISITRIGSKRNESERTLCQPSGRRVRRLMLSLLAVIGAVGPVIAGQAHGLARTVACFIIALAAGSMAYAAQQSEKEGALFPIALNTFN
jgi:hypothetical protein